MARLDLSALNSSAIQRIASRPNFQHAVLFTVATLLALAWLTPFYYVVISMFKTNTEYGLGDPLGLPSSWKPLLGNLSEAWIATKMGVGLLNSALYGAIGRCLATFLAALACLWADPHRFSGQSFLVHVDLLWHYFSTADVSDSIILGLQITGADQHAGWHDSILHGHCHTIPSIGLTQLHE